MKDSEPTSLRSLLKEFEESEVLDVTLCCHDLTKKSAMSGLLVAREIGIWFSSHTFVHIVQSKGLCITLR